ncbi:methyltransferase, FxLD system [Actinacidiphila sp. DG2A-62]|uniref:methyltransferase, FxLD system n=1 Tax=Actinacidiphila sp. DG2A-62 TaxID=3108821 RepID=UPI002DBB755F|nr:methyltransferase, FxLD system [Actinacidiphila sp. DG2A-62]MEC3997221.1 methyltransferase, FxLD system [Actinacidiphila sp. DG2A-62]
MIEFADSAVADDVAIHGLVPVLDGAAQWWFIRKPPGWRLRLRSEDPRPAVIETALADLQAGGRITSWTRGVYEPEVRAFGGELAMDVAHRLFHHDSQHLLTAQGSDGLGPRERAVLLFSTLFRAAGLDWFEQGDVWGQVLDLRGTASVHALPPHRAAAVGEKVRRLMRVDASSAPELLPPTWTDAHAEAGQQLARLAQHGQLDRGLRAVLAHCFIFHANRAGLAATDQATVAHLAATQVFHTPTRPNHAVAPSDTHKVRTMTSTTTSADTPEAAELRARLTESLVKKGKVSSPAVEAAFRAVPRHCFVPGSPLPEAYADDAVYTKWGADGARISAASQPTIVALMLEQLGIEPGNRILEIGAGTGYNAALMATITGEAGHVTAVDVDEDLVDGARAHLTTAGVSGVDIILGDGALGAPAAAPYDRIIATVGAHEVPRPWLDQLRPDGRLVVPVRLRGAVSRSIVFERGNEGWTSTGSEMAVFMPLRGIGDDARRVIDLTGDGQVTLQTHKDNVLATAETSTLDGVLATDRHVEWTGVHFVPMESFEWLDLWLSLRLDDPLMRMEVKTEAREQGLVTPMFPTVAMATAAGDGSLAYLTIRPADPADDGTRRYEVGVIGHGPSAPRLAASVAREITVWNDTFRSRTVRFHLPDRPEPTAPDTGRFLLDRPQTPITVTWE